MNLTDYVIEWIFDSTAGKDPTREILVSLMNPSGQGIAFGDPRRRTLQSLNEPFGSRDCLRRSPGKNLAKLK